MSEPTDATAYRGPEIPRELGERLALALDLPDRPETLGDWADAMARIVEREDIDAGPEVLCTTDESPHRARFGGETQHYLCVQDAFIVPSLVEDVDTVEVTTESPVSGDPIEITATDDGSDVEPDGAVMSFGVAADVSAPPADAESPAFAYGEICPYGHAFRNRGEYEEWAATVDAVAMVAPMADALYLARAIGRVAP